MCVLRAELSGCVERRVRLSVSRVKKKAAKITAAKSRQKTPQSTTTVHDFFVDPMAHGDITPLPH